MNRNRRYESRLAKARQQRNMLYAAVAFCALLVIVLVVRAIVSKPSADLQSMDAAHVQVTKEAAPVIDENQVVAADDDAEAEALALATEGNAVPNNEAEQQVASATEKTGPNKLPIIWRKKDETKRIAVTIDDCFSADNMRTIMRLAEEYNADLTFFPKGETIKRNADLWREIYEKGYEIANHTYHHSNVSDLDEDKLRKTITMSEQALNEALGVNYHMTLFRCPTGDGMRETKLHKILTELGYQAVASWDNSGTRDAQTVLKNAKPGQLILFHATNKDVERLKVVIPGLAQAGYEMVSVNTLYGKGPNKVTPLDTYDPDRDESKK